MSVTLKQSVGEFLREARATRGITLEDAARETNIAKRYLEALENDQFGYMPAEMYTPGFLSAYAEVLELDKDVVLAMYNKAISKEQEVPLQELYEVARPVNRVRKEIWLIALGIPFAALFIYLIGLGLSSLGRIQKNTATQALSTAVIKLEELAADNTFDTGMRDTVAFEREGKRYTLEFQGIRNTNQIAFRLGKNTYVQKIGDILSADLTQDGINDIGIEIIDVGENAVRFSFATQNISASLNSNPMSFDIKPYAPSIKAETPLAPVGGNTSFRLRVQAEAAVWLQHQSDAAPSQETLLDPGEDKIISFTDSLILLLGNAGAAELSFIELPGVVVRGGAVGETTYSLFYKKGENDKAQLFRAQLK